MCTESSGTRDKNSSGKGELTTKHTRGFKVVRLQNYSGWGKEKPTIKITVNDPEWETAYQNWISGKNPTDSPEWKRVWALTEEI